MELKLTKADVKVVTDKEKGTSESVRKIESACCKPFSAWHSSCRT